MKKAEKKKTLHLPSLEEMKAEHGNGNGKGVVCPKCRCVQFSRVETTRPTEGGYITRYRVCRNSSCGHKWATLER